MPSFDNPLEKSPSPVQEKLDAIRQGGKPYGSPKSDVVSNTNGLRKRRQATRTSASNLLSAIQDTVIPPTA
jgi:hypothetical protein